MSDLRARLRELAFCAPLSDAALAALAAHAEPVRYPDGHLLFQAHSHAGHGWLITAGRVAVEVHGPGGQGVTRLETVEEGELLGWSWMFPPYEWHFDARAIGAVRAIRLNGDALHARLDAEPAIGFEVAKRVLFQAAQRVEQGRLRAMDVYGGVR